MQDSKPWYLSKTVWASFAAIIGALTGYFGLPIEQDAISEALVNIATGLAALFALYGRLVATRKIAISTGEG